MIYVKLNLFPIEKVAEATPYDASWRSALFVCIRMNDEWGLCNSKVIRKIIFAYSADELFQFFRLTNLLKRFCQSLKIDNICHVSGFSRQKRKNTIAISRLVHNIMVHFPPLIIFLSFCLSIFDTMHFTFVGLYFYHLHFSLMIIHELADIFFIFK